MTLPLIGHLDPLAIIGLACGLVAWFLFVLALCRAASDGDQMLAQALSHVHDPDEPWLSEDAEILDFQLARNRAGGVPAPRPTTTAH